MMEKRVLHVYPQLRCGGTEMVLYNLIKFGNHDKFQYDILIQKSGDNELIFRGMGCKIRQIEYNNAHQYYNDLLKFFSTEKYDVVHTHMHSELPTILKAAYMVGIRCRVAHSHNARVDIPQFIWPLLYPLHHKYERYATELFGCSKLALRWLFTTKWRSGHVINNGIDLNKFQFNSKVREEVRNQYGISTSTKVFINVGRCTEQKNQKFIIELASMRQHKDELYIIIGEGPLLDKLKRQNKSLGLDNVWFLGKRDNVTEWLCAADIFLFPSIYEGLGIVAIEAETNGLKVIATDTIPEEADMKIGNFYSAPLKNIDRWNELMDELPYNNRMRHDFSECAFNSEYNIRSVTQKIESIYTNGH